MMNEKFTEQEILFLMSILYWIVVMPTFSEDERNAIRKLIRVVSMINAEDV